MSRRRATGSRQSFPQRPAVDEARKLGPFGRARRIRALARRLEETYGPFRLSRRDPLEQLVATILSQATTDANSARAFVGLRRAFPRWEEVLSAPVEEVEAAIRTGGLARSKARTIKGVLAELHGTGGPLSLDGLEDLPLEAALERLVRFPGVGHKTACCVLLFALGRPAMPVDTHVHRLSLRLGLVAAGSSALEAHRALQSVTPSELVTSLHLGLVHHGRATCRARSPRCSDCVLASLCPSASMLDDRRSRREGGPHR